MFLRDLQNALSAESKRHLARIFRARPQNEKTLLDGVADELSLERLEAFERFLQHPGTSALLERHAQKTWSRFDTTFRPLLSRLELEIHPDNLGEIAGSMATDAYRNVERSFFFVPVDAVGFRIFQNVYLRIGEQDRARLEAYLEFCSSAEFANLKQIFLAQEAVLASVLGHLGALCLADPRPAETLLLAAQLFVRPDAPRYIFTAHELGRLDELLDYFCFEVMQRHFDPAFYFVLLKKLSRRYASTDASDTTRYLKREAFFYERFLGVRDFLFHVPADELSTFTAFLKEYGEHRDDFAQFIWDLVFDLDPAKSLAAMRLVVSTAFTSVRGFYGQEADTLKFLARNIITALTEMELDDFDPALYKVVLKLLLGLKVERNFLRRRAQFFAYVKETSGSLRLELEVVRFLFYEYIYIALKQVDLRAAPFVMTKYCDADHEFFCKHIDESYAQLFRLRGEDPSGGRDGARERVFAPVLERLRERVRRPLRERFAGDAYRLDELFGVSESMRLEDEVAAALFEVEPVHLADYHEVVLETFRNQPDRLYEAVQPNYWSRVTLMMALSHCHGAVMPLVGGVRIVEGRSGAYTDGRTIFLPAYVDYFRDRLEPLHENRNLTIYVGLALHESGHIIAGSHRFNLYYYLSRLEYPWLFKTIMNIVEDYRIETFLKQIRAHPQIDEILDTMNEYFAYLRARDRDGGLAGDVLFYMYDEACGYTKTLNAMAGYRERVEAMYEREVNTGRFRNVRALVEYGIDRLRNLDVGNPLAAYPLAREMYEIMKHWPESDLRELNEPDLIATGEHTAAGPGEQGPPLTREQLDDLYAAYNENPAGFLREHDLPVFPELTGSDEQPGHEPDSRASDLLEYEERPRPEYESAGTIDDSHRTKADDLVARRQSEGRGEKKRRAKSEQTGKNKKRVYGIDPRTRSRTKLTEVEEFVVDRVNSAYFRRFRKWEYLAERVYRHLALLMPTVDELHDTSAFEGELNTELLIEILSDRSRPGNAEFLDIYRENRRSLEAVIGIDASGSTAFVIEDDTSVLDVEKAFAIIFGRALSHLTDRVSIYAFNSLTSTNVYRARNIEAVSAFESDAANRDGDFFRFVTDRLAQSDADVKYFFHLSDGQPAAENYGGKEAMDDTLIAMRETVNAGIQLVYFNIDSSRGAYFDAFQKEATYARHFSNPEQLLPAIPELVHTVVNAIR